MIENFFQCILSALTVIQNAVDSLGLTIGGVRLTLGFLIGSGCVVSVIYEILDSGDD